MLLNTHISLEKKKRILIFIFLLLIGIPSIDGETIPDSLQTILKQKRLPDSLRIDALVGLGWELKKYKIEDALPYAEAALDIASKAKDFIRLSNSYFLLAETYRELEEYDKALAYYRSCNIATQQIKDYNRLTLSHGYMADIFHSKLGNKEKGLLHVKKMQEYSEKTQDLKTIAFSIRTWGIYYGERGEFDKCFEFLDSSFALMKTAKDSLGLTMLYMYNGHYHAAIGNYDKAIPNYQKSFLGFQHFELNKYKAETLFGIGTTYQTQGNNELAMKAFLEALTLATKVGDENRIALCYENIANVYKVQKNLEVAESYYFKALDVFQKNNNRRQLAGTYLTIGNFYREQKDPAKALEYLNLGEELATEINSELHQATALENKALVYEDAQEFNKALDFFQQALGIYKALGRKGQIAEVYQEIAEVYDVLDQHNQAILYAKRSFELALEINKVSLIQETTFLLSENYETLGFHKAALDYFKLHKAATDTLVSTSNNLLQQLQTQFESDEMSREYELLRKANALKDSELNRQRTLLIFAILIVVLVGLLAGTQYRSQRMREKANQGLQALNDTVVQQNYKLQDLNREIGNQNEELQKLNREIGSQNEELQQFAYIASHDLQEPLRMVGNFVQLLEEEFAEQLGEEGQMYINFAVDGVTRMSQLIDDLLLYSRVNRKEGKQRLISIQKLVDQKIKDLSIFIREQNAEIIIENLPEAIHCEPSQMGSVFQNLIHNGMKFNNTAQPTITVKSEEREDSWLFSIKDNGIGIAPKNHDSIFDVFTRLHRKEDYKGTGIGLALVKRIIEQHGGEIWLESSLGQGTTFFFTLPKEPQIEA